MKISLPKNYSYRDIAFEEDGTLYIVRFGYFEPLMYDLTYSTKDYTKCHYCSSPLNRNNSTLDHMYPRDLGGPAIPNNFAICCRNCNSSKSNMFEDEFFFYLSLPLDKKREFFRESMFNKIFIKKWYSPMIPKDWMSYEPIEKIAVHFFIGKGTKGKSYNRIQKYYKKSGRLYRPIIVDKDFNLLDGFNVVLFAKNNYIEKIPTIVLENVSLRIDRTLQS